MISRSVLVIGHGIPEPQSTGAGVRMVQLLELFKELNYKIQFSSTADTVQDSSLTELDIPYTQIRLNCDSFDDFVAKIDPKVVVFDRFMTQEQFGWRVTKACPKALTILDTEDLHFLRNHRQHQSQALIAKTELSDIAKRELAAIYRCDLSLLISEFEVDLLTNSFGIPKELLFHLPFLVKETAALKKTTSFEDRQGFYFVGNGKHAPNVDAIYYLYKIWPLLKKSISGSSMHIYGAYLPESVLQMHKPEQGFFVHGYVKDLITTISKHRVLLAPLRFGAGQKRKIFDAWLTGSAVVTTDIGAEAIADSQRFGGTISNTEDLLVKDARLLYSEATHWAAAVAKGQNLLKSDFSWQSHKNQFREALDHSIEHLAPLRIQNTVGQLLSHHSLQSTKYLSKWIQEKNRSKEPPSV
ncbi:MAG: glycosyltransferase [Gilvibacter sp.]